MLDAFVVQDGILRADCQAALFCFHASGRIANPPQAASLHHNWELK
jgi:hypothetical protein